MGVRLPNKPKPNNYTEPFAVNKADRWRERACEYPGRSHGRGEFFFTNDG
ncbi:MAG TPA: arginase [Clostridium sp.]|nr:arginase [Clostridium sp.]